MPKNISLHLHSLLRKITLFIFPQHRNLHFAQNLPGAAGFYSYGNSLLWERGAARLPGHHVTWGGESSLPGSTDDHISTTAANGDCVFFFTPVVIPIVHVREILWLLKHYIS
jgi:hypothetical protein